MLNMLNGKFKKRTAKDIALGEVLNKQNFKKKFGDER